jgi:nucleoside phosphorylase
MEGAAFMLVCKHFKKNFIQIRGISNIILKTKRENWDFNTPINNYSDLTIDFLKQNK